MRPQKRKQDEEGLCLEEDLSPFLIKDTGDYSECVETEDCLEEDYQILFRIKMT